MTKSDILEGFILSLLAHYRPHRIVSEETMSETAKRLGCSIQYVQEVILPILAEAES
jgi:hypothetical protein